MKRNLSIQEHIEQERLQIGDPQIGCVGFLLALVLFYVVWNLLFSISWYWFQSSNIQQNTTSSFGDIVQAIIDGSIKYFVYSIISFILSLPITLYLFDILSNAFEKLKPALEQKIRNDDVLDAD